MFGDGMVSLGTAVVTWERRKVNASAKIVSSIRTFPSTWIDAGVNSMSPAALWNWTFRLPGALDTPPRA
jgi:hypothetical protein